MEGAKFASKSGGLKGFLDVGESLRSLGATVTIGERFEWRQLVSPLFAPVIMKMNNGQFFHTWPIDHMNNALTFHAWPIVHMDNCS